MNTQLKDWRERLRTLGKQYFEIEEMMRLGFVNIPQEQLNVLEKGYKEIVRINKELQKLNKELQGVQDVTPLLKEIRRKRIERVKAARVLKKIEKKALQEAHKRQVAEKKRKTPYYLGEGVSKGLKFTDSEATLLQKNNLPLLQNVDELAEQSKLTASQWIWLSYHRRAAEVDHYTRFQIPKKKGGFREIAAPKKTLRQAQGWLLVNILSKLPIHEKALAFTKGKSIQDNAQVHLNKAVVLKMDLKDFFPSIKFPRVKGLFKKMGYNEGIATLLALVCTDAYRVTAKLKGKAYYVALGERFLPQGACTSPAITNMISRHLDVRLHQLAEKAGWQYTRYADDLTFSTNQPDADVGKMIKLVTYIVKSEDFTVHPDKTTVMRPHQRQAVTGIVVNNAENRISRRDFRKFRAFLHQLTTKGEKVMSEQLGKDAKSYAQGYWAFIHMVNPTQAQKLKQQYEWL
ncbi:MAG: retron St85 family RNA-directed DNA polymerase [Thermonemataceae bacterium]